MSTAFYFYLLVLIAGAIVTLLCFGKLNSTFRLIGITIVITLISEGISREFGSVEERNLRYTLYAPLYFGLTVLAYRYYFVKRAYINIAYICLATVLGNSLLAVAKFGFYQFSGMVIAIDSLAIIICSLLGFLQLLQQTKDSPLSAEPSFWLHTSMIFYWSFSFLRNGLLVNYSTTFSKANQWFEYFHTFISILYYLALAVAIFLECKSVQHAKRIY